MSEEAKRLEWLREALAVGDADIRAGRTFAAEDVLAELERRRKARSKGPARG